MSIENPQATPVITEETKEQVAAAAENNNPQSENVDATAGVVAHPVAAPIPAVAPSGIESSLEAGTDAASSEPSWVNRTITRLLRTPRELAEHAANAVTFVFDTSMTLYYVWMAVISLAVIYNLTFIIVRACYADFQSAYLPVWFTLDYLSDVIYLLDMFVKTRTGYLEQGLLVRDLRVLAITYVRSVSFVLDVISIFPTDLLYLAFGTSYAIVRINRLLRITRLSEFLTKTESKINSPNAFRIAVLIFYILMIIHWNGCLYFSVSKFIGFQQDEWTYPGKDGDTILDKYIYCYWWATVVLTNIAEVHHPQTELETFLQVTNFLIGLLIFASLVGKVGTMITSMNAAQNEFQFRLDSIKQYMKFRKVSPELQRKVLKWFDYIWTQRHLSNEEKVLRLLPEKLRAEIAIHVHLETLKRVKLFQDCEAGLLVEMVLKLRLQVFSPGDYICRKGDIGKEMYICKSGKLEVVADDGIQIFATLSDGSVFGEISLLSIPGNKTGNRRTANVRSKGYSDVFVLSKEDLYAALREYPDAMQKLVDKGTEILRKEGKIDEDLAAKHKEGELKPLQKLHLLESHVDKLSGRLAALVADFSQGDKHLKQRLTRLEQAVPAITAAPITGAATPSSPASAKSTAAFSFTVGQAMMGARVATPVHTTTATTTLTGSTTTASGSSVTATELSTTSAQQPSLRQVHFVVHPTEQQQQQVPKGGGGGEPPSSRFAPSSRKPPSGGEAV